jgi:NADH-quinone oxidoreductase subunit E
METAETAGVPSRTSEAAGLERILAMIDRLNGTRGAVIAVLEEIQAQYGYLPEKALRAAADGMGWPLVDMYGVATFYRSFSLKPRGRHLVRVCLGTACHVRGAPMVVEELQRQLGIAAGETTPDGLFTLETVNCLGACALGPIVVVDECYFPNVDAAKARAILNEARAGLAGAERQTVARANK